MNTVKCSSCGSNDLVMQGRILECQHCSQRHLINPDELERLIPIDQTQPEIFIPESILIGRLLRQKGYLVSFNKSRQDLVGCDKELALKNSDKFYVYKINERVVRSPSWWWQNKFETIKQSDYILNFDLDEDSLTWRIFVKGSDNMEFAEEVGKLVQHELGYEILIVLNST